MASNNVAPSPTGVSQFTSKHDELRAYAETPAAAFNHDGRLKLPVKDLFSDLYSIPTTIDEPTKKVYIVGGTGKDEFTQFITENHPKYVPEQVQKAGAKKRKFSKHAALVLMIDSLLKGYRFYEKGSAGKADEYLAQWDSILSAVHEKLRDKYWSK
eukprot:CAMPEP_0181038802 /NCGR_PEP_ID=MMETSP1070-20121207/10124_1 /TAXON_ID=265543 /ORGANISM="Minutocellus polymorphus, Strain NH13" /LENGTH=155 /DNA_ID=CAMNT_0023116599 /DNA_START=80 /DNA_END=547 /DNA_ORIENTATION=-